MKKFIAAALYYSKLLDLTEPILGKENTIRMLCYHRISDDDMFNGRVSCVSTQRFSNHIMYLKEKGFTFLRLKDIRRYLNGDLKLPKKSIVLTFDDGFKDNYTNAYPILKSHGISGTFFVTVMALEQNELLGHHKNYLNLPRESEKDIAERIYLSCDDLREMHKNGMDIGSHGMTHSRISKLGRDAKVYELSKSKERIESEIDTEVELFSYPFEKLKDISEFDKAAVKESGYEMACCIGKVINNAGNIDLFALERIGVANRTCSNFAFLISSLRDKFYAGR